MTEAVALDRAGDQAAAPLGHRRTEVLVGAMFLLATVAYLAGSGLVASVTGDPGSLAVTDAERSRLFAGVLLELVNCAAVVTIAVLLFPVLRRRSEAVAAGYLAARVIEATILAVGALAPVLLVTLGRAQVGDGGGTAVADLLGRTVAAGEAAEFRTAMIALGLGSLLLCHGLYHWRLVPRPLALLGYVGYALLLVWGVLGVLQGRDPGMGLFVPGAVFELAFPVWLFVRGLGAGQGWRARR
jgi:hypothetical protein